MKNNSILTYFVLFVLTSCSTLKPESFKRSGATLDPIKFFDGHTHSTGVLEARSGKPTEHITTKTTGVYDNRVLRIEQDLFYPDNGKQKHRTFELKLIDVHHLEGTGSDITGIAKGELYGNYFAWRYRLKIADKGIVRHVNIAQHMYLMPDGKTLIIRSVVRKFGIVVKEITEQFHKDT
ncbi:DUF3833 family protein [Rhodocytophaga aerolata]|uniref:DUF3833 family protein n=1 Tax=Rhodocytophaga aerolata TaxID=455078 RepID=A0ABT8RG89_9BACT|nr:DUF3833 family protein [Rhodocytophaga aerolata]MDO1451124.1 DUF3833 family protein [Rhodocytophaga aerolata]